MTVAVFREVFKFISCTFSENVISVCLVMSYRQITRKEMARSEAEGRGSGAWSGLI
jgi:hypothetical protein